MAYNYEYPYTDTSRVNSDWIIKRIIELSKEYEEFVIKNEIKYADPIQWNISKQYEKYIIVTNENKAYLSKKEVPNGVMITDTSYWLMIADYGTLYDSIKHSIASADDKDSTTTTEDRKKGSLVWLNDVLYEVQRDMNIGDAYVMTGANPNVLAKTVEELLINIVDSFTSALDDEATTRENADNDEATNRTNADNDLSNRINLLGGRVDSIEDDLEDIYDVVKNSHIYNVMDYGAKGDGSTDDTQAFIDCISDMPRYATLYAPSQYTYKITDTLTINKRMNFMCYGDIEYYGDGACIEVTTTSSNISDSNIHIRRLVDHNGNSSQPSSVNTNGTVGIHFYNYIASKLFIGQLLGWTYAGVYFDGTGDNPNVNKQIMLHNYIEILEVGNCGIGFFCNSLDASTDCFEANEIHIVWELQCYNGVQVDGVDTSHYASTSNYFLITALDNATNHGLLCGSKWNTFEIAFASTSLAFDGMSEANVVRVGNNINTDAVVADSGSRNRITMAMPNMATLPARTNYDFSSTYRNDYGVPIQVYCEAYCTDSSGEEPYMRVALGNNSSEFTEYIYNKIDKDSETNKPNCVSFTVPAFWYYKIRGTNCTARYKTMIPS